MRKAMIVFCLTGFLSGLMTSGIMLLIAALGTAIHGDIDVIFFIGSIAILACALVGLVGAVRTSMRAAARGALLVVAALGAMGVCLISVTMASALDPVFFPSLILYMRIANPLLLGAAVVAPSMMVALFLVSAALLWRANASTASVLGAAMGLSSPRAKPVVVGAGAAGRGSSCSCGAQVCYRHPPDS